MTSVTIPNGVTSIGGGAFSGCTGLTSIAIPNSVTSIGENAFEGCIGLTKVNYMGDVKGWLNIDMQSNPLEHAKNLYINNTLLTNLIIPEGITNISPNFRGCTSIVSVTIPNSVTSIGDNVFSGCTGIDTLIIGNGITEIGDRFSFSSCSNIKYLQLGSGLKSIGDGAFYNAQKLKRIVCYAVEPPMAQKETLVVGDRVVHITSFYNYNIHVQVPCVTSKIMRQTLYGVRSSIWSA